MQAAQDPSFETLRRIVPPEWGDYNGHMNEGKYGQVFSDAADEAMRLVGVDAAYLAGGHSFFTVEALTRFLMETRVGEEIEVRTRVTEGGGKKFRLFHEMRRNRDDAVLATCNQLLLHVDLGTRRSCEPMPEVRGRILALLAPVA
jgi:carnitine 3-dehydrogenase